MDAKPTLMGALVCVVAQATTLGLREKSAREPEYLIAGLATIVNRSIQVKSTRQHSVVIHFMTVVRVKPDRRIVNCEKQDLRIVQV